MTLQSPPAVPEEVVKRFVRSFDEFLAAVRAAVLEAAQKPEYANTVAFKTWQNKVLPKLDQQYAAIQNGFALYQIGETGTIARLAEDKRGLAKDLDGFPITFAGPDRAQIIDRYETAVVRAAFDLCLAARIP